MLIKDKAVVGAEQNEDLGLPVRYLATRLAELLDPGSHFSLSGNERIDPLHLLEEFETVANGFLGNDGTHRETMQEASAKTRSLLKLTRHLNAWYPSERNAILADLLTASQPPSAGHGSQSQLRNYVKNRTGSLIRGSLATFRQALSDSTGGYRHRLLAAIEKTVVDGIVDDQHWREYDEDLIDLGGLLLADGRDGARFACRLASRMAEAEDDETALAVLKSEATSIPEHHRVVFILHGTRKIPNASAFGCTIVEPHNADWGVVTPRDPRPRGSLRVFLDRRIEKRRACGLIVEVEALDPNHARALAVSQAEQLRDQLAAEHRLNTFRIDSDAMVLTQSSGDTYSPSRRPAGVARGRTLTMTPIPDLQQSLRFHALAQGESEPVVSVLHSWIALESLAAGARTQTPHGPRYQGAGAFLPPHLAAIVKMTSVRQLLASTWWIARARAIKSSQKEEWEELEGWLGARVPGRTIDIDRWKGLLLATSGNEVPGSLNETTSFAEAASWLELLTPELGIFADRRIRMVRWLLANGERMVNLSTKIGQRAEAHVSRMNWLRNKAVHNAMTQSPSAQQLARSAYDISDAVFEVLPHWLAPGKAPWEALGDFREHSSQSMTRWRTPAPVTMDCAKLVEP